MPLREQHRIKATTSKTKKPECPGCDDHCEDEECQAAHVPCVDAPVATGGVRCFSCGASPREQLTAVAGRWYCSANCRSVRDDDVRRTIAPMNWKEFETWLRSGEDAPGSVGK